MKPRGPKERCVNCPAWDWEESPMEKSSDGMAVIAALCKIGGPQIWNEDGDCTWPTTTDSDWCIRGVLLMREES